MSQNAQSNDERRKIGRQVMREVLGAPYCERRDASTNDFNAPIRRLSEEFAYGSLWTRPGIDRKTRSMVTLGMLTALNRPHEMALHLEAAVNNGCSVEEIRETLTHTVAYCGFPAAIDALRAAEAFLRDRNML
jgi:4-carboxymuconolactone decarboxylase